MFLQNSMAPQNSMAIQPHRFKLTKLAVLQCQKLTPSIGEQVLGYALPDFPCSERVGAIAPTLFPWAV